MWRALTACLMLFVLVSPVSARHRHHHRYHVPEFWFGAVDMQGRDKHARKETSRPVPAEAAEFVPPGWTLQPPDPKWTGKRFVSPDGRAWFAAYSTEVAQEPVPAHMRAIAFVDGETPTFIRGESDRIAVAGTKGDRMFYRKAVIACGGRTWHHIAFEYPIDMGRYVDPMLRQASMAADAGENDGCDAAVANSPAAQPQPETTGAAPAR
jgi:serine/threonine-protein kinase